MKKITPKSSSFCTKSAHGGMNMSSTGVLGVSGSTPAGIYDIRDTVAQNPAQFSDFLVTIKSLVSAIATVRQGAVAKTAASFATFDHVCYYL